ncbi:hypothetical protein RF11_05194 [Thelohanellus kitauei]|uniref:Uncharacterized protein n=1 Tax=Thelohanellus kitauei TaxID=669202 RepID=A0A0C2ME16_THEKT|nr:hypothetical protein RF11_05194 [Thelohanellus kitauei]
MVELQRPDISDKTHKVFMGGSYVGIPSDRYRADSVTFENDIAKKNNVYERSTWQIVQIDESVISRAMNNRGHDLLRPQCWVLGMYYAASKMLAFHADLGSATLSVYPQYIHQTVNHSVFFRDQITGSHTNNVEAYCDSVKKSFQRGGQTNEKMWRERYGKTPEEVFEKIISQWAEYTALN